GTRKRPAGRAAAGGAGSGAALAGADQRRTGAAHGGVALRPRPAPLGTGDGAESAQRRDPPLRDRQPFGCDVVAGMSRIYDFRQDEHGRWEALLECGHVMPVRHRPPYINRPWVLTAEG